VSYPASGHEQTMKQVKICGPVIAILCFLCFTTGPSFARLTAVATESNDFATDGHPVGKSVPVPSVVARKIESLVDRVYRPEDKTYLPRESFFGSIFRITAPKNRYLYVFRRTGPLGSDFYFFMLFDPATNKITRSPPYIYGKWMEVDDWGAELRRPLLSFEGILGDGEQECVVEERVHNGTIYNAIVYHYYHMSSDLALSPILAVETRYLDLFTENQHGIITRTVKSLGKGQVRIEVSLDCDGPPPQNRILGFVILRSSKPGRPFAIVERTVLDPTYGCALITASGEDETKFVTQGYRFYY
jgi:hypothetical protein